MSALLDQLVPAALGGPRAYGRCADLADDTMFPETEEGRLIEHGVARARAVCADCPVRSACLSYALDAKERHGVWGGTTWPERDAILRERNGQPPRPARAWQGPGGRTAGQRQLPRARPELLALPGVTVGGEGLVRFTDTAWAQIRELLANQPNQRAIYPGLRQGLEAAVYKLGHGVSWPRTAEIYGGPARSISDHYIRLRDRGWWRPVELVLHRPEVARGAA